MTVKGDIGENQTVKVTATPPTMTCSGSADVVATFEDGYKTEWSRTEATGAGTAAAYTVKAVDLTPGSWTGTAMFNCELESLIAFTIGETSYQAAEGMTWAEWVNSDYNTDGYKIITCVSGIDYLGGNLPDISNTTIIASATSTADNGAVVIETAPERRVIEPGNVIDTGITYELKGYVS